MKPTFTNRLALLLLSLLALLLIYMLLGLAQASIQSTIDTVKNTLPTTDAGYLFFP